MGFLDKFIKGVNAVAEPVQDIAVFEDRTIDRAAHLAADGTAIAGTIVGIERKYDDDTTESFFAISVPTAEGTDRFGVHVGVHALPRLRLGLPVAVRTDGKGKAVLDLDAMFRAWGLPPTAAFQRAKRSAPDDGIVDRAIDMRVKSHLKKWTPTTATISRVDPVTAFGMATQNWDVHVTLADGTPSLSRKDQVPEYAYWFAVPGAVVPTVVDPGDPSRCSIDWTRFATEAALAAPAAFDDQPPPGSITAIVEERARATAADSVQAMAAEPSALATDGTVAGRNVAASNATVASWIQMTKDGYMKPKDFEKAITDWQAAGMCTAEDADTARAAIQ